MFRTYYERHLLTSSDLSSSGLIQHFFPEETTFIEAFNTRSTPQQPVRTGFPYVVAGEIPYIDIIVDCSAAHRSALAFAHLTLTIVFRHDPDRQEDDYSDQKTGFDRIVFCEPLPLSVHGNYAVKKRLNGPFEVGVHSAFFYYYTWHSYALPTETIQTGTDPKGCPIYTEVPIIYQEHVKITLISPPSKGIL